MSKLPPKPDFAAIESVAHKSAGARTFIMSLIGHLVYTWSNNESMFIYVLMVLMNVDEPTAAIIFATLNTTRARLDLVERLAKLKIRDSSVLKSLERIIARFNEVTRIRNEFNHCMYKIDERGVITHTHSIRVLESRGQIQFGVVREVDGPRMEEITGAIRAMTHINRALWDYLPRLQCYLDEMSKSEERAVVESASEAAASR